MFKANALPRKKVIMLSDLLTFLETLPEQSLQTGEKFLPDSFDIYLERLQMLMDRFDNTQKMVGAVVSLILALLVESSILLLHWQLVLLVLVVVLPLEKSVLLLWVQ